MKKERAREAWKSEELEASPESNGQLPEKVTKNAAISNVDG